MNEAPQGKPSCLTAKQLRNGIDILLVQEWTCAMERERERERERADFVYLSLEAR